VRRFSQRTKRGNHCLFFEKRMAGVYHNSAYIIDTDGSEAGLYRKMHIPDDPHFYEKFYFTPGDLGFKTTPKRENWNTYLLGSMVS
jgi:predicted amidohydrolase